MGTDIARAPTVAACPALDDLEASPRVAEVDSHVLDCAGCQMVDSLLALRRDRDPDLCDRIEDLIATLSSGTASTAVHAMIRSHLATCEPCREVLDADPWASRTFALDQTSLPTVSASQYTLGRELARGGMGRVIEARDLRIGRPVAVKELLVSGSVSLAMRFEREARMTARLQHPGIVPIYEIGTWTDGTPFYTMRLIAGTTLGAAISRATTLDERLAMLPAVITAAEAMAFAHGQRVIHRDLKPANVMVGAYGETVVIDWGLAKDLTSESATDVDVGPYRNASTPEGLTAVGAVIGTAAYMPPEQAAGELVDARGDVYALGVILYELLAGHPPYRGLSSAEILCELRDGSPTPVGQLAPGAPTDLVSIVDKAMSRRPSDRYPTANELVDELRRFQTGRIVEAHAYSRRELARRWLRRNRAIVLGSAAVLVALVITGGLWFRALASQRDRANEQERRTSQTNVKLLEEQGRQYLLAGDEPRALAYLDEAMQQGLDTLELRFMMGTALSRLETRLPTLACLDMTDSVMSHDGTHFAARCGGRIRTWALATGTIELDLPRETGQDGMAYSADDRWLAIGGATVAVFDAKARSLRKELTPLDHPATLLGFARDAVAFAGSTTLELADPTSDAPAQRIPLAVAVGERWHSASRDGSIASIRTTVTDYAVWDLEHRVSRATIHGEGGGGFYLSPDGATAAAFGPDGRALLVETASGRTLHELTVVRPAERVVRVRFDADGHRILVATTDGDIETWDVGTGVRATQFTATPGVWDARWVAFAHAIAVQFSTSIEVRSVDGQLLARYPVHGRMIGVDETRRSLLVAEPEGIARLSLANLGWAFDPPAGHRAIAANLAGDRLLTVKHDTQLSLWDARTGDSIPLPEREGSGRFSRDGTRLAIANGRGVTVVDALDGKDVAHFDLAGAEGTGCDRTCARVFASDGHRVLVWDVATGRRLASLDAVGPTSEALSLDGKRIGFKPDASSLRIVDVDSGANLGTINQPGAVTGFDASGTVVAVWWAGMLHLWKIGGGEPASAPASFGAVASDGRSVTSFISGQIQIWRLADLAPRTIQTMDPLDDSHQAGPIAGLDDALILDPTLDAMVLLRSGVDGRILSRFGNRSTISRLAGDERVHDASLAPHWNGDWIVGLGHGVGVWRLAIDRRSPVELHAAIAAQSSWRIENGALVPVARSIRGRVVRRGRPIAGAYVEAVLTSHLRGFTTRSGPDGTFTLGDLPNGELAIHALDDESVSVDQVILAGSEIVLELPAEHLVDLPPYDAALDTPRPRSARRTAFLIANDRSTPITYAELDGDGAREAGLGLQPKAQTYLQLDEGVRVLVRDEHGEKLGLYFAAPARVVVHGP